MSVMVRFLALSVCDNYSKSSIKLPPGAYLFETHLRVGLIRDGGLFKRWGGGGCCLLNLAKKVVSVLHKELEYQVQEVGGHAGESETNPNFQLVNKPFDHTTFYSRDD